MVTLAARLGQNSVGATLVVARFTRRVRQLGDHKGRPY
jgi:hypothetical protein